MAKESVGKALEDAKVSYGDIQQAIVGYVYGKFIFVISHYARLIIIV